VVRTLANAIANDRVAHAFLLCGPRGVGKTTTARLLARALNCIHGPTATPCGECLPCQEITKGISVDVAEIDGASNNGVDNIRELRETARYLPQRDRYKIFIIDEVHMLSVGAFNALLKTLEEPPPHVKFIFATTDPQKLPETILSRCQRHNFRRVTLPKMVERLRKICEGEGIAISDRSLQLIGRQADGGMRDALSLLDQLISSAGLEVSDEAVEEALGLVDRTTVLGLARALVERDGKALLSQVAAVHDRGIELKKLCEELAFAFRDLLYVKTVGEPPADRSDAERKTLEELAAKADPAQLSRIFDLVHGAIRDVAYAAQPRLALEVALLTAVNLAPARGLAELAARLEALAGAMGAGVAAAAPGATGAAGFAPAPSPAPAPGGGVSRPGYGARPPAVPPPADDLASRVAAMARSQRPATARESSSAPSRGPGAPVAPGPNDQRRRPQAQAPAGVAPARNAPPGDGARGPRSAAANAVPVAGFEPAAGARSSAPTPAPRPARPGPPPSAPAPRFSAPPPPPFDDEEPPPPGDDDAPPPGFDGEGLEPMGEPFRPSAPASAAPSFPPRPAFESRSPPRPRPAPSAPATGVGHATAAPASAPAARLERGDDPSLDDGLRWRKALEAVKTQRPLLAMHLSEGRLLSLKPGEVALGYTPDQIFHRKQVDVAEAQDLLSGWFGAPLVLRVQDASPGAPTSVAEDKRREWDERARRLTAAAEASPEVQLVKEILGGEIEEIRVLGEE
jgi:DNA polymerase-3 subunit gamma/tau